MPEVEERRVGPGPAAPKAALRRSRAARSSSSPPQPTKRMSKPFDALEVLARDAEEEPVAVERGREVGLVRAPRPPAVAERERARRAGRMPMRRRRARAASRRATAASTSARPGLPLEHTPCETARSGSAASSRGTIRAALRAERPASKPVAGHSRRRGRRGSRRAPRARRRFSDARLAESPRSAARRAADARGGLLPAIDDRARSPGPSRRRRRRPRTRGSPGRRAPAARGRARPATRRWRRRR